MISGLQDTHSFLNHYFQMEYLHVECRNWGVSNGDTAVFSRWCLKKRTLPRTKEMVTTLSDDWTKCFEFVGTLALLMFSWQSSQEATASNDAKEEKDAEKEEKETKDAAESSSSSSAEGFGCHGRFDLDYFRGCRSKEG